MNRKSIVKSVFGLFAAVCAALAFVVADVGALTQNTNSSTTEQNTNSDTTMMEGNANTGRRARRGRRGRRARPAAAANADASGAMTDNTNTSDAMPAQDAGMADTQSTGGGTNEDVSGTYAGRVRMSGGHEMNGEGTLTITGNTFTIESEGMTHNGRIYAVNTRKYIGAALIFEDLTDSTTNTPLACSVRVRMGRTFSATPVPGSRNKCWFAGRKTG
ncbi:MAG TPA: hypothetical protein VF240_07415 [Pyrinomonadaceae bacterium]